MGVFRFGMFKGRQASRPAPAEVPTPTPPESITDPHQRNDLEFEESKRRSHEALVAAIRRDGTDGVGFSSAGERRDLREGERHPLFRWRR